MQTPGLAHIHRARLSSAAVAALLALVAVLLAFDSTAGGANNRKELLFEFGGPGTAGPGKLREFVNDVAVDFQGNVWVVDPVNRRVVKYTFNGGLIAEFDAPIGGPRWESPDAIATDRFGFVYVGDVEGVVRMDTGGNFLNLIGNTGPLEQQLQGVAGIAVDRLGVVSVASGGGRGILKYSVEGNFLGTYTGERGNPGKLAVNDQGELFAVDTSVGAIQRFGADGEYETTFGTANAVAIDSSGIIHASGTGEANPAVRRYTRTGTRLSGYAKAGDPSKPGEFNGGPGGIALDCRDNAYLTDGALVVPLGEPGASKVVKFGDPDAPPPPCAAPLALPGVVDAQVNDIEVTQGIQPLREVTTRRGPNGGQPPTSYNDTPAGQERRVNLAENRKTVVRVYANLAAGPPGGIGNVPALLEARRGGDFLGRIQPIGRPAILAPGDTTVGLEEREDPSGAYTFVLPPEWTREGEISLKARVNPARIGCTGPCLQRSLYTLRDVRFRGTRSARISPLMLTVGGEIPRLRSGRRLIRPQPAFSDAQVLTPIPLAVEPYRATVDVTDVVRDDVIIEERCFLGVFPCETEETPIDRDMREGFLFHRLREAVAPLGLDRDELPFGVLTARAHPDLPGALADDGVLFGTRSFEKRPIGYADVESGPGIAHEIQHGLGRPHASACGGGASDGQVAEQWPPDNQGFLQGIGLDPRPRRGGTRGPFNIIFPPPPARRQFHDLMSYCGKKQWISPRGWNNVIGFRNPKAKRAAAAQGPRRSALRVVAVVTGSGRIGIAELRRVRSRAAPGGSSRFTLQAFGAGNRAIRSVPMSAQQIESRGRGRITILAGEIPAGGAIGVAVARDGKPVVARSASRSEPRVRVVSPRRRQRVGGRRGVTIRWRATDADRDRLRATVEYSRNGGRTWRQVFTGPNRNRVRLAARFLPRSRRARVRVTISDGFRESSARSRVFRSRGAAPEVRILEPVGGQRMRADGLLLLRGEAYDDLGRRLRGRSLRWFSGRRRIGRGSQLDVSGLRPGRRRIRLVARDRAGRRARRSVVIRVTAVRAAFLRLTKPRRVSRRARRVRLRIATTVAARLRIGRRKRVFRVGRRTKRIVVRVRRGRAPLRLPLTLRTSAGRTRQTIVVPRR